MGGRDSAKGGRGGAWTLPVAPGLYRAVPAGIRPARITSCGRSGSLSDPVVSGHRGNSARDTLISARRASSRRVSRGVQQLNVSSSSASMPLGNPMDGWPMNQAACTQSTCTAERWVHVRVPGHEARPSSSRYLLSRSPPYRYQYRRTAHMYMQASSHLVSLITQTPLNVGTLK